MYKWKNSVWGNYSGIQNEELKTQRVRAAIAYPVYQNIPRVTRRYQITEDQDQREQIKCLYLAIKDCNRPGL